jgi:penicillin-binding protein 1C
MKIRLSRRLLLRAGIGIGLAVIAIEAALRLTPMPAALESGFIGSTEFLDREGRPLRLMLADERRYAQRSSLQEVSPQLIAATLSAEDQRFRSHWGIDLRALTRAVWTALRAGKAQSGASTITQQLVKVANPGPRNFGRKLGEMWMAVRVERAWSKDRILEEYLNRLDYGNLQVGIASASRYYFAKPPSDLSAAEAAFLAGLPRAPTRLDPHEHFAEAQARQRWVLGRMLANGRLAPEAYARAVVQPLQVEPPPREFEAPHFVDLLLQRRGVLPAPGGPVRTTLDLPLNRFVECSLADQLAKIADKNATSGAVVVIHNPTGDVLALASSGEYFRPGTGQVNGAWIVRSPGSVVKAFTYLLALERGANPSTVVPDVPTDFSTDSGLYRPNNYNHRFYGPVSLRFALGNSLNIAAVRTLQLAGGPEVLHRRLCDLGLTTLHHETSFYGLGLTLGNGEVRLLELASAFASIGRLGIYRPYRLLLPETRGVEPGRRVFDARAAYLVADMLADNGARTASFGLNSYLAFDFPVACKTGTSSDYRDNWVMGCTPEFTVGVWVGNVDGSAMRGITGVTGAAPVMHDVFMHLRAQRGTTWFARPERIETHRVSPLTGRLATTESGVVTEKCLWPPEQSRSTDIDAQGRVVLPPEYAPWLASAQNGLGNLVTCASTAPELRILQPPPGATYFLDPDLPLATQWVALRAEARGAIAWSCASLPCEQAGERQRVQLRSAGRHIITARDTATGRTAETWIEVREL